MLFRRDVRRLIKSGYIWFGSIFAIAVFAILSLLLSHEVKIGVSIFGNITSFTDGESVLRNVADYTKGMGLLLSILISVFIGKEYRYKTWQHPFSHHFKRKNVYLSKLATSVLLATMLYLCSEIAVYAVFQKAGKPMSPWTVFFPMLFHGTLLYSLLAAIVCCISMVVKNHVLSLLLSISFVLFEGAFIKGLGFLSQMCHAERIYASFAKTTLYGMNEILRSCGTPASFSVLMHTVCWISLLTIVGIGCFRRYEV